MLPSAEDVTYDVKVKLSGKEGDLVPLIFKEETDGLRVRVAVSEQVILVGEFYAALPERVLLRRDAPFNNALIGDPEEYRFREAGGTYCHSLPLRADVRHGALNDPDG
jgi:hypothetical protein